MAKGKKCSFSCPVSYQVAWDWGFIFKTCPLVSCERDMEECRTCKLRGQVEQKRKKDRSDRKRKSEHTEKEKTYVS